MHVVVFTRSSSVARALAFTTICCSILQYNKRTKPSADKWAIDPWVRVVPSFFCASLFQSVCVRVGDDVFLVATLNLLMIFFTRYRIPLLGAFSCKPSVSPEPSAARMLLLILCLSPTGYCCRERHKSLFVLGYTDSRVWFLYYKIRKRQLWDRGFNRNSSLQAARDTSILYEAKQGCGVVSCTTFGYWGARWSKVLVLIWYHIICMYVRIVTFDFSLKYVFHFFSRYVGTWYLVVNTTFFLVSITCGATRAGRILFDTNPKRENSHLWTFEVRVMLLIDRSRAWTILTGTHVWIACGHTTA